MIADPSYDLIIFDIDGTLVTTASGQTFRERASDWMWMPGRLDTLRSLYASGVHLAIATNQGAVAFGKMEEADIRAEIELMVEAITFGLNGHPITVGMACGHPRATIPKYRSSDDMRKPGGGMLRDAMAKAGTTPERTLMVGDMDTDRDAAHVAHTDFAWADSFFRQIQVDPTKPSRRVSEDFGDYGLN